MDEEKILLNKNNDDEVVFHVYFFFYALFDFYYFIRYCHYCYFFLKHKMTFKLKMFEIEKFSNILYYQVSFMKNNIKIFWVEFQFNKQFKSENTYKPLIHSLIFFPFWIIRDGTLPKISCLNPPHYKCLVKR